MAIPCYVSGKGMYASDVTWNFKVAVITALEESGLGYDTRFRYYRDRFPDLSTAELARKICDPIEYYDTDWPPYFEAVRGSQTETEAATRFMLERDLRFQDEAKVAIYCFDEAGFGSGANCMRFLHAGKHVLGFYRPDHLVKGLNLSNILQLEVEFPELAHLKTYSDPTELSACTTTWLKAKSSLLKESARLTRLS